MNRKTKRYAVGGETDEKGKEEVFKGSPDPDFESNREVKRGESEAGPSSFKEAFAEARRRGDKTFMWNGERKTTELASSKPKAAPKAETKTEAPEPKESSGSGPKNTFLTKERSDAAQKAMSKGFSMGLFERGDLGIGNKKKEKEEPAKIGNQSFAMPKEGRGLTPYEKTKSIEERARMLGRDEKTIKKDEEKLAETRRRAAGKYQKSNEAVYGAKKGGAIQMASGGKVKSASARADGCCVRGKTRA